MKSSVCIFTEEPPAKLILQRLRNNYLQATHTRLESSDHPFEIPELHVIEADESLHPAILEEIAELEEIHPFLFRCDSCESARVCLDYGGPLSHFLRSLTSHPLGNRFSHEKSRPSLTCRSCRSTLDYRNPEIDLDGKSN